MRPPPHSVRVCPCRLAVRMKKKDEITSAMVESIIVAGGASKAKHGILGEDNDPDIEINPVAVAKIKMEKEKAVAARKAEKAKQAAKHRAKHAAAGITSTPSTAGASAAAPSGPGAGKGRKAQLNVLGIHIDKDTLPANYGKKEEDTSVGLSHIDRELQKASEERARRAALKAAAAEEDAARIGGS